MAVSHCRPNDRFAKQAYAVSVRAWRHRWAWLLGVLLVVTQLIACRSSEPPEAGRVVHAVAPAGFSLAQLGVPHDVRFRPLQSTEGATLFPKSGEPKKTLLHQMKHEVIVFESADELQANLSAWGLGEASAGTSGDKRYGTYRAVQIEYVLELDDTTSMRRPPTGAAYYPWRVFFGRSFEMVFSGSSRNFHAGVKADFAVISGELEAFAERRRLQVSANARGLKPKSKRAIFAKDEKEILEHYEQSPEVVPIFVEYRQIPRTQLRRDPISWIEPLDVELRYTSFKIDQDGTWGSTPWTLTAFCYVDGVELEFENPIWEKKRITDRKTYNLNWVGRLAVAPGSRLECGLRGTIADHVTDSQPIAVGKMERPVVVGKGMRTVGATFSAKDRKTAYEVEYTVEVVR